MKRIKERIFGEISFIFRVTLVTLFVFGFVIKCSGQSKWCDKSPTHPLCICEKNPNHPNCSNPTPVEFKSFTVRVGDSSRILEWEILSEKNNDHFTIQRSTDGKVWKDIAFISGRGTTLEPKTYSYTDPDILSGYQYYLLLQTDIDGHSDVLGIRVVLLGYNVVEGFKVKGEVLSVRIYDTLGASSSRGLRIIYIVTSEGRFTYKMVR